MRRKRRAGRADGCQHGETPAARLAIVAAVVRAAPRRPGARNVNEGTALWACVLHVGAGRRHVVPCDPPPLGVGRGPVGAPLGRRRPRRGSGAVDTSHPAAFTVVEALDKGSREASAADGVWRLSPRGGWRNAGVLGACGGGGRPQAPLNKSLNRQCSLLLPAPPPGPFGKKRRMQPPHLHPPPEPPSFTPGRRRRPPAQAPGSPSPPGTRRGAPRPRRGPSGTTPPCTARPGRARPRPPAAPPPSRPP
jgi:hypothetical protein